MSDSRTRRGSPTEALLGEVADEFTQRLARGEQPDIEEYAQRHPEIASVLRQVLPALATLRAVGVPAGREGAAAELPAERLGDYRLLREIGRGGMGVVYEAEQISLGRRVALKVLPFAAVLDSKQLRRFRREAQAAAQLHHSNIVPVFSVGCERGVHYYAMQYIDGQPLSAVIRELRQLSGVTADDATRGVDFSGATRGLLSGWRAESPASVLAGAGSTATAAFFRAVARVGVQAAAALEHAHERGVVHRDIKPANILLDADGHVWITDFGLAMMATDPGLTLPGDVLGTLRYMSPEQALARNVAVDQRTDVYSLGVTLYELLALRPALDAQDRAELLGQIAHQEPRPLRRVRGEIPRELETIVTKAVAKEPPERYGAVRDLGEDLQRFLDDRPILARPPTRLDRAAKWSRRHRTLVASAALLLVLSTAALSVGTVLITWQRAEAIRQRDRAQEQWARAEENFGLARDAVDRMLTRVAGTELSGDPHLERVRQALLGDALSFHRRMLTQKYVEADVQADVARAYGRVAHLDALLGQDFEAEQMYRSAIATCTDLRDAAPDDTSRAAQLADAWMSLAAFLWERGRAAEAERALAEAQAAWQSLAAQEPETVEYRVQVAHGLNLAGLVLCELGRVEEAEQALRDSAAAWERLRIDGIDAARNELERTRSLRNLAHLQVGTGRLDEAEETVELVLAAQRELAGEHVGDLRYGAELAHTERWWGEVQRAGRVGAETLTALYSPDRFRSVLAELPKEPWYREQLAAAYRGLDGVLRLTGPSSEVQAVHRRAIDLQQDLVQRFPAVPKYREDLVALHRLEAGALQAAWRMAEAQAAFNAAIGIQETLVRDYPDKTVYEDTLVQLRTALGDVLDGMAIEQLVALDKKSPEGVAEAVQLARAADLDAVPLKPFALLIYGEHLALGGDFERAAAAMQRALESRPRLASYQKSLGWALAGCGQADAARAAFRQALGMPVNTPREVLLRQCPDPMTAAYFLDLITAEEYTGRWKEVVLCGARYAPFPWFYVGLRHEFEGRPAEARAAYEQAAALGRTVNAHHTANWAAYRLRMLAVRGASSVENKAERGPEAAGRE